MPMHRRCLNVIVLPPCVVAVAVLIGAALAPPVRAQVTVGGAGSDVTESTAYSGTQTLTKIGPTR